MKGKISKFNKDESGIWGTIETADGQEFLYRDPGIFVKPGLDVEFELSYDEQGQPLVVGMTKIKIEYPELPEEISAKIAKAVKAKLDENGYILGSHFPNLLKEAGNVDLKMYAESVGKFIKRYLSDLAEMRSSVKIDGIAKPGVIVPAGSATETDLEIPTAKMTALNILDDKTREKVIDTINRILEKKNMIIGSEFPKVLLEAGISNFREYAKNIFDFVKCLETEDFSVKQDVNVNNRNYPCAIIPERKAEAELDEELRISAAAAIRTAIEENGFITGERFSDALLSAGVESFNVYSHTADDFISKYYSGEFSVQKNIFINGSKYPYIITFPDFDAAAYGISAVTDQIKSRINADGFADVSFLMSLIKAYKLDIGKASSDPADFTERYMTDLELQKNRVIDGMLHTDILVPKGITKYHSIEDCSGKLIIDSNIIGSICTEAETIIAKDGFILVRDLTDIFDRCGLNNYEYYAGSLSELIERYFENFCLKHKVYINGIECDAVMIRNEGSTPFNYFCEDNRIILDRLFDAGKYADFIRSPFFSRYRPNKLPLDVLEKGLTCAMRILTKDDAAEVKLNGFQRKLITAYTGKSFKNQNKIDEQYKQELIKECEETFLPRRKKGSTKQVVDALNNIGSLAGNTMYNEYHGLMFRAEACWNELYPLLTLINIILSPEKCSKCIEEMCNKVKRTGELDLVSGDGGRWLYFPQLVQTFYELGILEALPVNTQTLIFAVFLDFDALDEIASISHFFTNKKLGFMLRLLDDYKSLSESDFAEAFAINVNRELLQKICVKLWVKCGYMETLSLEYLLLLSYILKYDCPQSVDEIMRISVKNDGVELTKPKKIKILADSLVLIGENVWDHSILYRLGEYVTDQITQMDDSSITESMLENCKRWRHTSEKFFKSMTSGLLPVTDETARQIVELFGIFECNNYEMLLQEAYADWYFACRTFSEPAEEIEMLMKDHAYLAICKLVESLSEKQMTSDIQTQYLNALLFIRRYDSALVSALERPAYGKNLTNVITTICCECGISEKTTEILNKRFSVREAIEHLMICLTSVNNDIAVSLAVLYALDHKPFNMYYIYNTYGERVIRGYSKIRTQAFKWCEHEYGTKILSLYNKTTTKYTVIEKAFDFITPKEILHLLNWCARFKIPGTGTGQAKKQIHVMSAAFDKLLICGNEGSEWIDFYNYISNIPERNAWRLCVTLCVLLEMQTGEITAENNKIDFTKVEEYLAWMLGSTYDKDIPYNFICVIDMLFDRITDEKILNMISNKLDRDEVKERVFDVRINRSVENSADSLKQKCLSHFIKTGAVVFLDLAGKIDINFSLIYHEKIAEIIKYKEGKVFVLRTLCAVFANNGYKEDLRNIAAGISCDGMGYPALKLLEAVKFIFSEHSEYDELIDLVSSPELLDRVRKSAAKILSVYPSKVNMFEFERETFSAKFKLMVYSIVSGSVFDEYMFKPYFRMEYNDVKESDMLEIIAYFQYKLYLCEVYHNADHTFLYIERRYLKALTAKALIQINDPGSTDDIDDSEILAVMSRFEHKDKCYSESYIPFKTELMKIISDERLDTELKKHFIYVLLVDKWRSFLDKAVENGLEQSDPGSFRTVIKTVSQRESSKWLYIYFLENSDNEKSEKLINISFVLSSSVHKALSFIKSDGGEDLIPIVSNIQKTVDSISKKNDYYSFGHYIKSVLELDRAVFSKYKRFFIPFMASIQFSVILYDALYAYTVSGKASKEHIELLDYLTPEYPDAAVIKIFLECIRAAMQGDKAAAKTYFDKSLFDTWLSDSWEPIVKDLADWLEAENTKIYVPLRRSGDSSARRSKSIRVSFIADLAKRFKIKSEKCNKEEIKSEYNALYKDDNALEYDKIKAGLIYLVNSLNNFKQTENMEVNLYDLEVSDDKKIAYQVAYLVLSSSIELKPVERLSVLHDAYLLANEQGAVQFSEWGINVMTSILNSGLSLEHWCGNSARILDIIKLDSSCDRDSLEQLKECLSTIASYMTPDYPLDKQFKDLKKTDIAGSLKTIYAGFLQTAVNERICILESKDRLEVKIVNVDKIITDKTIYGIIKNNGKHTVTLGESADNAVIVNAFFGQYKVPISFYISTLQAECVSGFSVQIPAGYNEKRIDVTVTAKIGDEIYSECTETLLIEKSNRTVMLNNVDECFDDSNAVSGDMFIGREDIKMKLRNRIKKNVLVLYGPSRIGKTSIMNWLKTELSKEIVEKPGKKPGKRIITISIAPEGSARDNDYVNHFMSETPLDYGDNRAISEYLLADSIKYGLKVRADVTGGEEIDPAFVSDMCEILNNTSDKLTVRYQMLSKYLLKLNTEIWLLFDEFQQVVEKWKALDGSAPFSMTFADLRLDGDKAPIKGIRIVLCGSDELLKHMECKDRSIWRDILGTEGIPVGPLDEGDFKEMIEKDKNFAETGLSFAPEAVETLYNYTGGIALYGKKICNTVLSSIEDIHKTDDRYFLERSIIYPSDISMATQMLIKRQDNEQKSNDYDTHGIYYIYDAVAKNLNKDTDELYLRYIAQWLLEHPNTDKFPKSCFYTRPLKEKYGDIESSLTIVSKRRILREVSDSGNLYYKFTTLFYYHVFLGMNRKSCNELEQILFDAPIESDKAYDDNTDENKITFSPEYGATPDMIKRFVKWNDPTAQSTLITSLLTPLSGKAREDVVKTISKEFVNIEGDVFKDNQVNNFEINVFNNITNTFSTLLTGDVGSKAFIEALGALPSLRTFIPEDAQVMLEDKTAALLSIKDKKGDDEEELCQIENEIEQITSTAEQKMIGVSVAAATNSTDFFNVSAERWKELIYISRSELEANLSTEVVTALSFAVMLHNVFETISEKSGADPEAKKAAESQIDYCPVAIMYCKIVESMLKNLHTRIYAEHLSDKTLNGKNSKKFGDLKKEDGTIDTADRDLSIGSFSFQIVKPSNHDKNNNIDNPDTFAYEAVMPTIQQITNDKRIISGINSEWKLHALNLAIIRGVRNKSAHDARPITRANFEWLIETLFKNGELLRIALLAENEYPIV